MTFEERSDARRVVFVSTLLSLVSGIVNAVAIIEMGGTVAHHTGNASHVGRLAGTDSARFGWLMVAYLAGAAVAGYCRADGEALYEGRCSPSMLSSALAVAGGAAVYAMSGEALVALPLLSFSQGLQNCVTRRSSTLPICTTHMTGYLTDAGMHVGAAVRGCSPVPLRTKLFVVSILAFVGGGFLAKALLDRWGIMVACVVPSVIMAVAGLGMMGSSKKKV